LPNTHFFYRAADITAVDDKRIGDTPASPDVVDVGRILRELPRGHRPDRIMGPASWHHALGYPRSAGFLNTPFHNEIHADHLHIGFSQASGTTNTE
jgi:hypothetical protein